MKKPVEAIERVREWSLAGPEIRDVFAYLDSIQDWPADLTRERLEELATYVQRHICSASSDKLADALRRLAAIAPKVEKRKVRLWRQEGDHVCILWQRDMNWKPNGSETRAWTIVGEAEIDA